MLSEFTVIPHFSCQPHNSYSLRSKQNEDPAKGAQNGPVRHQSQPFDAESKTA